MTAGTGRETGRHSIVAALRRTASAALLSAFCLGGPLAAPPVAAQKAETCSKQDFEAVVDEASAVLVALNNDNKPKFEAKLLQLKAKRGWSEAQFLEQAAPLVRDRETMKFDRRSEQLLAQLTTLGEEGSGNGAAPDCRLLRQLNETMEQLVETQKAKWAYMFKRLDEAIAAK